MSLNFGGGSNKSKGDTTIQLPPADPAEKELKKLNLELNKIQIAEYLRGLQQQQQFEASPTFAAQRAIEEKATANILARLTGAQPVLSPEEQGRLDEIYGNSQRTGEQDLRRFAEEIASARGLAVSDSPVASEALRQQREFSQNLQATKAGAAFDLGNAATTFAQQQQQFANALRQQAYMNRLAFASQAPASFGFQNNLFGERMAQAGRSFSGSGSNFGWGAGVSGKDAGGFMQGLGGLGVGG